MALPVADDRTGAARNSKKGENRSAGAENEVRAHAQGDFAPVKCSLRAHRSMTVAAAA